MVPEAEPISARASHGVTSPSPRLRVSPAGDDCEAAFNVQPCRMASNDSWQVSGSAAQKYERFVASWFEPWAVDLVARADVPAGCHLLDLACGTGVVTRAAAPVVGKTGSVVASDLNEGMLTEAQQHETLGPPVQWRQADALDLPFDDDSFDVVLCQQGLQFVPDIPTAVAEIRRVLRSGGVAAVSVWRSPEHNPYISALANGLTRHVSPEAGQVMLAPCAFGNIDDLRHVFRNAGFSSVEVEAVTIHRNPMDATEAIAGNLAALPVSDEIAAMDEGRRSQMISEIADELQEHITNGQLTSPNSANVVVAVS